MLAVTQQGAISQAGQSEPLSAIKSVSLATRSNPSPLSAATGRYPNGFGAGFIGRGDRFSRKIAYEDGFCPTGARFSSGTRHSGNMGGQIT